MNNIIETSTTQCTIYIHVRVHVHTCTCTYYGWVILKIKFSDYCLKVTCDYCNIATTH